MSNKIYFSQRTTAKKHPRWFVVRSVSKALYYLLPSWAARITAHVLLTPQGKSMALSDTPADFSLFKLQTAEGEVQCYETGRGPLVLLTHGWSGGAYQFFPLMRQLAADGYTALAFDHPGHGASDGQYASAPQFVRALQDVLTHLRREHPDQLAAIVTHSMGGIAAVNVRPDLLDNTPLCLIAPVFQLRENMSARIQAFGLYPRLFEDLLNRLRLKFGVSIDDLEMHRKLPDFANKTLILHDRHDRFADVKHTEQFCQAFPETRMALSDGLGHGRILDAENTGIRILKHIQAFS